jgi:organic hydroperoxide reductase OsmC/OhrA
VTARAKRFEYWAGLRADGTILAEGGAPVALPGAWTPEHLLLAALARCTLKSLVYHARDIRIEAEAEARGVVTRRDEDGRYGLVDVEVELDVRLDPAPPAAELADLLARAERDCFVGNSLAVKPRYRWSVDGQQPS